MTSLKNQAYIYRRVDSETIMLTQCKICRQKYFRPRSVTRQLHSANNVMVYSGTRNLGDMSPIDLTLWFMTVNHIVSCAQKPK